MKTETMTVIACEVKAGDSIHGEQIISVTYEGCVVLIQMSGLKHPARIPIGWLLTISRPVADECPRGRMVRKNGWTIIGNRELGTFERNIRELVWQEIVKLWNEHEDRTTAEIEAGEVGK